MNFCLSPSDLGLSQFHGFRPNQGAAILRTIQSRAQFQFLDMPVGEGKSLTYTGAAILEQFRTALLTVTKPLERQLMGDFERAGLVKIHGRNNYDCVFGSDLSCEDGADIKCSANKDSLSLPCNCPYKHALFTARQSNLFTSNYTYWALVHKHTEGLGPVGRIVCDEGHELPEIITSINSIYISERDIYRLRRRWPDAPDLPESWRMWATQCLPIADQMLLDLKGYASQSEQAMKELGYVRSLCTNLAKLVSMHGWWIPEQRGSGWRLEPVLAAEHAESTIWRGTPKILISTATMATSLPTVLGIQPGQYEVFSYPSSFPAYRSPFYFIPTARVHYKWKPSDMSTWLDRIDEIIGGRLDRKGIIHSTSYERTRFILANSRYRHLFITHESGSENTQAAIARFKAGPPPAILISPSITTGYDFPHETCRYQILANVPYPDTSSKVMQARTGKGLDKHSPQRAAGELYEQTYIATQIAQAAGRAMRADTDWCENFMIDDKFKFAYYSHQGIYPLWFHLLVRTVANVPPPLNLGPGPYQPPSL